MFRSAEGRKRPESDTEGDSEKACLSASSSDTADDRNLLECAAKSSLMAVKIRGLKFQETFDNYTRKHRTISSTI
jgi:hypothetical protein